MVLFLPQGYRHITFSDAGKWKVLAWCCAVLLTSHFWEKRKAEIEKGQPAVATEGTQALPTHPESSQTHPMASPEQRRQAAAAGGGDLDLESAGGTTLTIAGPSPSCNKPPGDHTVMEQSPQVLCLASLPRGDDPTPSPSEKQNSAQKFEQKVSLSGVRLDIRRN